MKKLSLIMKLALVQALAFSLLGALAEATTAGIWEMTYYVDEFRMPTDEAYMRNVEPIEGIFSNSATTDSPAGLVILVDEQGLSFMLYEYGTNLVKNSFNTICNYIIIMRDSDGAKIPMSGGMRAGGDRIVFNDITADVIQSALELNGSLAFYIEEKDNPTTNYLFTIPDTSGFAEVMAAMSDHFNERDYQAAVALWDAGDYQAALEAFGKLGDYKDSAERDGKYRAMMYERAEALLEAGDYDGANAAFIETGNYQDAKDRIGEPYYVQAEAALAVGQYDTANQAFINAGSYSDAADRVGEPYYTQAEALLAVGEYEAANEAFINAGSYSDAADRVGEPYYAQAEALLAAGQYEAASQAFINAGGFSDAADRVLEPYYVQAEILRDAGDYDGALAAYTLCEAYKDTAEQVQETYYRKAKALAQAGSFDEAYATYATIRGYKDVNDIIKNDESIFRAYVDSYDVGKIVRLGSYEQDNNFENGREPIEWIVLEQYGGYRLLLSKYIIEKKPFHDEFATSTNRTLSWTNSSLRSWLNEQFYNAAFSDDEKEMITVVETLRYDAGVAQSSGIGGYKYGLKETYGYTCQDKVVLPSTDDCANLIPKEYLEAEQTEYVRKNRPWGNDWWLGMLINLIRTDTFIGTQYYPKGVTTYSPYGAYYKSAQRGLVGVVGVVNGHGSNTQASIEHRVDSNDVGVRPAIFVCVDPQTPWLTPEPPPTPTPKPTPSPTPEIIYPTLQKGSKGEDVKRLQRALIDGGYLSGKADGDFGKLTEAAVKDAQQALSLEANGMANDAFQRMLYGE